MTSHDFFFSSAHPGPSVYGMSSWTVPDGGRLVREVSRYTYLGSEREIVAWAKRHRDVRPERVSAAILHLSSAQPPTATMR